MEFSETEKCNLCTKCSNRVVSLGMARLLHLIVALFLFPSFLSASPVFNKPHGLYNHSFFLSIKSENEGVEIRYTLDGSEPTTSSNLYNSSFIVDKTMIVRAAEFRNDSCCSSISSVTYIFPNSVADQNNSPEGYPRYWGRYCELSGRAIADYEMDPELMSNRKFRNKVINSFSSLPILSMVTDKGNLFNENNNELTGGIYMFTGSPVGDRTGRGWQRPVSIELFGGPQKHDLTVDCAIQIHGGHSRLPDKNPKHSFRVTFKSDYGPSKLYYPVFGENNISEFNGFIIRTFFGDSWTIQEYYNYQGQYIRDQWMRMVQKKLGHPYSDGVYVHAFINGLYWGIYNLTERINDCYCKYHFGGKKESYDVIKKEEVVEAADGNLKKWNELLSLSGKAAQISAYNSIAGVGENEPLLDVDNFIDYMLLNFYVGNVDWDHHNWYAIRNRDKKKTGFQFISWDGETIFYDVNTNLLNLNNSNCPTGLFHNLMENNNFKHRFIDRAYLLLSGDGMLTEKNVVALWDSLYNEISDALYAESARWGDYRRDVHPYARKGELFTVDNHYAKERNRLMSTYFPQRTEILIQQLLEKGWYAKTMPPVFKLNGSCEIARDTLNEGDVLTFDKTNRIVYTLDGTSPISWSMSSKGSLGNTAKEYKSGTNILDDIPQDGIIKVRAICQTVHGWSPTIDRVFYVNRSNGMAAHRSDSKKDNSMYNLSGQKIQNAKSGIIISNGRKVFVR